MSDAPYTFFFDNYEVSADKWTFHYHYEDAVGTTIGSFAEHYTVSVAVDPADAKSAYILQQLHIVVGISYYKSLLGRVSHPYEFNDVEAEYYNEIYDKGLGEFAYINQLTEPIRPFQANSQQSSQPVSLANAGSLLGIGGGKDSIVTTEILRGIGMDTTLWSMATRDNHGQAAIVIEASGMPQLSVERYLDTEIIAFTEQYDGMNGHIPLSVLLAWVGLLLAYGTGKKYVMMSNESSTSIGNIEWNGREVNHQWAKSFEAEQLTQRFVHTTISSDLWYFSPIRPYGSLAVMELFAGLGAAYYSSFTSCNLVLRIDPAARPNGRWCTQCAKCLSSWLLLTPRLSVEQLTDIFGRNLFEDVELKPLLASLLGLSGHKPLDCVGTIDELRAVTRLLLNAEGTHPWPLLTDLSTSDIPGPSIDELVNERGPANLPPELETVIANFVTQQL